MQQAAAVILAAGKSTRMQSDLPKVLHEICGRPMLEHVLQACRLAGVDRILVVIGHGKKQVLERFGGADDLTFVEQTEQKGTGHAVLCTRDALADFDGSVLVIAGDMPLVRRESLVELLHARAESGDAATLATTVLEDPTGYGRIIRDAEGKLEAIVEERDCAPEQREIREVNPSYYCFERSALFETLERLQPNETKGEYYITDVVAQLRAAGRPVSALETLPAEEATGINARIDLALVGRLMQDRIQYTLLDEGVTIVDPDNTWIEAGVSIGADTMIYPFSFIGAEARIGSGCRIGPFAHVPRGAQVANGAVVTAELSNGVGV